MHPEPRRESDDAFGFVAMLILTLLLKAIGTSCEQWRH